MHPPSPARLATALLLTLPAVGGAAPLSAGAHEPHTVISKERIGGRVVQVARHADSFRRELELFRPPSRNGLSGTPTASAAGRGRLTAMPARWCGSERSTDDTRHAVSDAPQVKVVYAHPRGAPNRFGAYKDLIQQDVAAARALVASASGGRRTIRFDMGTDCAGGGSYVDIQSVALPHDAAYYGFDPTFASKLLAADLRPLLRVRGIRNVTTYVDGVTPGSVTGIASQPLDDRRGARNAANRGGQRAFIFGDGSPQFTFNRTRAFVHETTHNLGAVQDGAPHATGAGHCFDGEDVMCYEDGGPAAPGISPAPTCTGGARFDCRANDYFAVAPARGSYLRSHWNLFDSDFMCAVAVCDVAGAGAVSSASVRSALRLALRPLTRTLRHRGVEGIARGSAFHVGFRSPGRGRLELSLAAGSRRLASGNRSFDRAGRGILRARLRPATRRLARARRLRLAIRLSFTPTGRRHARRFSVVVVSQG